MDRIKKSVMLWFSVLVGLITWGCDDENAPLPNPTQIPSANTTENVDWEIGQIYTYELSMSNRADVDGQGTMIQFSLTSSARVSSVRREGERVDLRLQLDSTKIQSMDPAAQGKFDALAVELGQPYFFSMENGLVVESWFRSDATGFAVGILRTLSAALQYAPGKGDQPSR